MVHKTESGPPVNNIFGSKSLQRFFVDYANRMVVSFGEYILKKMQVPTRENTYYTNTQYLILIRDWFFEREKCPSRVRALEGLFNYAIAKLDQDPLYSFMADRFFEKWLEVTDGGKRWDFNTERILSDLYWEDSNEKSK